MKVIVFKNKKYSQHLVLGLRAQKIFGFRVVHYEYLLLFCPGQIKYLYLKSTALILKLSNDKRDCMIKNYAKIGLILQHTKVQA